MQTSRQGAAAVCLFLLLAASSCRAVEVRVTPEPETETEPEPEQDEHETQDAQAQDQVAILKQINRHNDDGSYTFGYEAADGSFKIETRDVLGNVKGMFGFVDEGGQLKRVSYSASNATGFQSNDGKPGAATAPPTPPLLYQQIIRPGGPTTRRPQLRPYGLRLHDTASTTDPTTQRGTTEDADQDEPDVTARPVVIQSIPRIRQPQGVTTTTETPEEPTTRRPQVLLGNYLRHNPLGQPLRLVHANGQEGTLPVTVPRLSAATFGQYIRPPHNIEQTTPRPDLKKLVYVTRRPVAVTEDPESSSEMPETQILHAKHPEDVLSKDKMDGDRRGAKGNAFRRQLGDDRVVNIGGALQFPRPGLRYRPSGTDDAGDVYGGAAGGSERPVPDTPFRGLFTSQPRIVQNALQQGYGDPGARYGPAGGLQLADLGETRNVPGVRIPLRPYGGGQYALGPDGGGQYALGPGPQGDLQQQLQQLILAQQQPRYRPQPPVPALTPFQQALMQTLLGGELPPELLQQLFQTQAASSGYPQNLPYNPQQGGYPQEQLPYPPQQVGYNPQQPHYPPPQQQGPYVPQPVPYPSQQIPYSQQQPVPPQGTLPYPQPQPIPRPYTPQQGPQYGPQQGPYNQPLPYDPQQYQPVQFPPQQGGYPYDDQQNPYQPQRRFRFRPRPGYISPPPYYPQQSPFNLRLPIPVYPYDSPQVQYQGAGGSRVGAPQQLMPTEYRDALLLRMLLAIRGDQERAQEQQPRAFYRVTEQPGATPAATSTPKPTRAPLRSVQILDPVTEEPTSKRSTNSTAST